MKKKWIGRPETCLSLVVFLLAATLFSGCQGLWFTPTSPIVKIDIPARPTLSVCESKPDIFGTVVQTPAGLAVQVPMDEAKKIRDWMGSVETCYQVREVHLLGHVEKLENRLRVFQ